MRLAIQEGLNEPLVMYFVEKVLRALTLATAGLAALIFPVTLFALQVVGEFSLELIVFLLTLYLFHPVSIVLIILVWFKKLAPGRPTQIATSVIALNVLLLLAAATLIQGGAFKGDSAIPILFAVPSFLFLLQRSIGAWRNSGIGRR